MGLSNFKCKQCGNKIQKIQKITDIFNIKRGYPVICRNCGAEYAVNKYIGIVGNLYTYMFIGGLSIFILFGIVYIIDSSKLAAFGIEVWLLAIALYFFIEFLVAISLPLTKQKEHKDG